MAVFRPNLGSWEAHEGKMRMLVGWWECTEKLTRFDATTPRQDSGMKPLLKSRGISLPFAPVFTFGDQHQQSRDAHLVRNGGVRISEKCLDL